MESDTDDIEEETYCDEFIPDSGFSYWFLESIIPPHSRDFGANVLEDLVSGFEL